MLCFDMSWIESLAVAIRVCIRSDHIFALAKSAEVVLSSCFSPATSYQWDGYDMGTSTRRVTPCCLKMV
jgi:hypothetical protein